MTTTRGDDVDLEHYTIDYEDGFNLWRYYGTFYCTYYGDYKGPSTISSYDYYAGVPRDAYVSQGILQANSLQQQVLDANNSTDPLSSGIDPQKDWIENYINQYWEDWNEHHLDSSLFRSIDDLKTALEENFGVGTQQTNDLLNDKQGLYDHFVDKNGLMVPINANILNGFELTGVTEDGAVIETSNYAGEPLASNTGPDPFSGHAGDKGCTAVDINLKNGYDVEGVETTTSGLYRSRATIDVNGLELSSDRGSYANIATPTFSTSAYNFVGSSNKGFYFGTSCDIIGYGDKPLTTINESIVYVPAEVIKGQRVPVTNTEAYGKLLYDIYNNGKISLTQGEQNLIQTQTALLVQATLANATWAAPGNSRTQPTLHDIEALSSAINDNIFGIVRPSSSITRPISLGPIYMSRASK